MAMKRAAVLLSGCGVYDGTECMEACAMFFSLHEKNFDFQCYAPNKDMAHVIDHTKGETIDQKRNVLIESARLSRGNVKDILELKSADFDVLFMPGGFGAAKNLSTFGFDGDKMIVDEQVSAVLKDFHQSKKWIAACCIAPIVLSCVLKDCKLTLGSTGDNWPYGGSIDVAKGFGSEVVNVDESGILVDEKNRLVTAPAFMYEHKNYFNLYSNVRAMVEKTASLM